MAATTDGVVALFPTEAQRMFRVAGIATVALGCAATLGGTFLVTSGVHLLQTRELGLGAVGLQERAACSASGWGGISTASGSRSGGGMEAKSAASHSVHGMTDVTPAASKGGR